MSRRHNLKLMPMLFGATLAAVSAAFAATIMEGDPLLAADGGAPQDSDGMAVDGAPAPDGDPAAAPADSAKRTLVPACTASPIRLYGLFPASEPARFVLRFPDNAPKGRYRLEWTMSDHIQRPLGTGSASFELDGDSNEATVDIVPADADPGYVYAQAWFSLYHADGGKQKSAVNSF